MITWGLPMPRGATYHWSARAIYDGRTIDLVWDRMGFHGAFTEAERKALGTWLDGTALPRLRRMAREHELPRTDEHREASLSSDGFTLTANPLQSGGYLYLSASRDRGSSP